MIVNLNDTPSGGPLTAADLAQHWPPAAPRIPRARHVDGYGLAGLLICAASIGIVMAALLLAVFA